ncbi:ThiF family adenylyltransferase [Streptomyces sp. NPDC002536]
MSAHPTPTARARPGSAHPMIKPALRRAWRDRAHVQFGVGPAHAVLVGPVDTATSCFLGLLDGTRGLPLLREEARGMGLPEGKADGLVERLGTAGLLDDPRGGGAGAAALRERSDGDALQRLRPDLASLSVLHREPGAAMRLMAARQTMRVQVRGAGRVGAAVAALLSASGVGRVDVMDGGCVEPWDVTPGGVDPERTGERRDSAARRAVRRAAPLPRPRSRAGGDGERAAEPPLALVVFAPRDGLAAYAPDPAAAEEFLSSGTPHMYAGVLEATGVVGPLVLPGATACAACIELGRAERDPAWPRMLAQWRSGRGPGVPSCDMALATVVAGLTVVRALAFLDGGSAAGAGVRLDLALPGPAWSPRPVEPHPRCPCGAAGSPGPGDAPAAGMPHGTMAR